jgi:DNA-binding transcriptional regulator YiaG
LSDWKEERRELDEMVARDELSAFTLIIPGFIAGPRRTGERQQAVTKRHASQSSGRTEKPSGSASLSSANPPKELVRTAIGLQIRGLRKRASATQEMLAESLGKPQSYVSKCEAGKRDLSMHEILAFAWALRTSALEIVSILSTPSDLAEFCTRRSSAPGTR